MKSLICLLNFAVYFVQEKESSHKAEEDAEENENHPSDKEDDLEDKLDE